MGSVMTITLVGTPIIAAGISKKVKRFIKLETVCLKAQARLNSSLL
jgi:hypothetical protein